MKEKTQKRRWGLMLFIVLIMVGTSFSVFLYNDSPQAQVAKYNGIKFSNDGSKWTAKISGKYAAFSFLPSEVMDIKSPPELNNLLSSRIEIDVTSEFNSTYKGPIAIAQDQMSLVAGVYDIYLRTGFTANNSFKFPVITCNEATTAVPVIYFLESNLTEITVKDNCVIAKASSETDFIRVKDRLVYGMLGVMK